MTEQPLPARAALAVSPSLSLRQVVRPLIFAHSLLASEQPLAGQLAAECERLSRLTTEALEASAQVHLLAPDKVGPGAGDDGQGRRAELITAYTKAATTWAKLVGTAIALGTVLLDSERVHDARRLADFLEAAGEPTAAKDLRAMAKTVRRKALEHRLTQIHSAMLEAEIISAIDALRESGDAEIVAFYISQVAESMANILPEQTYISEEVGTKINHWYIRAGDLVKAYEERVLFNYQRPRSNTRTSISFDNLTYKKYFNVTGRVSRILADKGTQFDRQTALLAITPLPQQIGNILITQRKTNLQRIQIPDAIAALDEIEREFRQQVESIRRQAGPS